MRVSERSYGVDVASFQSSDVKAYAKVGAKFVIVKISQSTNYINPKASEQLRTAKANGAMPMAYFYATFSNNSARANAEANYAAVNAKKLGLPAGSYFAVDWESGSGNECFASNFSANTSALIEALDVLKAYGYKPLLYSGGYLMKTAIDTLKIIKRFGSILWVAAYQSEKSKANFGYFPSMDGVAIWQFTDNWKWMNVDGNINVLPLDTGTQEEPKREEKKEDDWEMSFHPVVKWDVKRIFAVTNKDGAYLYKDTSLKQSIELKKYQTLWQVYGEKDGAIQVGKDLYFDGRAGITKSNPIAENSCKHCVVKVMFDNTHALTAPNADASKAYALKKGTKYECIGREGRFLQLKTADNSKRYVTGNRAYVVL